MEKKTKLRFDDGRQYPTANQYQRLSKLTFKKGQQVYQTCLLRLKMEDDFQVGRPKTWTYKMVSKLLKEMEHFQYPTSEQLDQIEQLKGDPILNELISKLNLKQWLLNKQEIETILKELNYVTTNWNGQSSKTSRTQLYPKRHRSR